MVERTDETAETTETTEARADAGATAGGGEVRTTSPRRRAPRASRSVASVVKENPIPLALIGLGVGWLIVSSRSEHARRPARPNALVRGKEAVGETVGEIVERGRNAAGYVAGQAQEQAEWAKDSFQSAFSDNPLAVGAVALAAGAIVGALLPQTETENRLMGEARDSFVESAQEAAQEAMEEMRRATEELADKAKRLAAEEVKNLEQLH